MKNLFVLSYSFIYLLLAFGYRWIAWQIPPINPFSTINSISISVNNYDFTAAFSETAGHANPGAERNFQDITDK